MKKYWILLLIVFSSAVSQSQLPVSADSVYRLIKNHSIHRNIVNWQAIDSAFTKKLQTSKNTNDTLQSLLSVLSQLKDVHSQLIYNNKTLANYPSFDDSTLEYLVPLVNRSQQQTGIIKTAFLQNKYVYIQLPGINAIGTQKVNEYAQAISDSICKFKNQKPQGFIVDLRINGGGQLSSMIAGINLLLGNGYLGAGVDIDNNEVFRYELRSGNFYISNTRITSIKNKCTMDLSKLPVAVLIGPVTRSSGSITAIAFKQRPKTWFIGEPTADGYSTGNVFFPLGNNFLLNLSTTFNQDRKKIIYKNSVPPDQIIKGGDDFDNLLNDQKIRLALVWLEKIRK
ncbi:MAG: hypothetical protein H7Y01_14960 [Ferruginibacter sp.]|nr:hypothetical protein [Chitinophagaceae bacterium]